MALESPAPAEPDVAVAVFFSLPSGGLVMLKYSACITAARELAAGMASRAGGVAEILTDTLTAGLPRLPNERLYLL